MAMLAEPKNRKRYHLVPKGKALYEDESRFGTKMLEMMGWKKGQGLGANEDGSKDFVRVRYKNNNLGLGFEHRDDQWTQHDQDFNGLLKTLNNEENGNESENDMSPRIGFGFQECVKEKTIPKAEKLKEKISGVSLEERSKQSRARVHYKKFTKGKDLAQYSEKDLANIFGKKVDEPQTIANDLFKNLNNTYEKNMESFEGVQMVNTGISVNEYFKTKLEAHKNRKKENNVENNFTSNECQLKDNVKKRNDKYLEEDGNDVSLVGKETKVIYSSVSMDDNFNKTMEDIKSQRNVLNTEVVGQNNNSSGELKEESVKKKKKSKKYVKDIDNDSALEPVEKKSKKNQSNVEDVINNQTEEKLEKILKEIEHKSINGIETVETPLKNKKNKTKNKIQSDKPTDMLTKKRKHSSSDEIFPTASIMEPRKKKQKKNKTIETIEIVDSDQVGAGDSQKKYKLEESNESAKKVINKKNRKTQEKGVNSCSFLNDADFQIVELDPSNESTTLERNNGGLPSEKNLSATSVKSPTEIASSKQRLKENETMETNEIIQLYDCDTNSVECSEEKKKSRRSKTSSLNVDNKYTLNEIETVSEHLLKEPAKAPSKDVSSNAINVTTSDDNIPILNIEDVKKKYNAYNIYRLSSFCAEKFRNLNISNFKGSTLSEIVGYGLGPDLQLDVQIIKNDEKRITNLWKSFLNKYTEMGKNTRKTYYHYVKKVVIAHKNNKRAPKPYARNAFHVI